MAEKGLNRVPHTTMGVVVLRSPLSGSGQIVQLSLNGAMEAVGDVVLDWFVVHHAMVVSTT